jgi:hypothetical protein
MDALDKNIKYKFVDKFLTQEEVNLLREYTITKHIQNKDRFSNWINTSDTHDYADPLMESLLISKTGKVEEVTNKKLFPTYSFWRLYTNKADLEKHTDRPSCEISVTINLGGDKPWPIYMGENPITLQPGQAVVYFGREIQHYRKEFDGDYSSQVFLHYVDQNGPYKEYHLDKREGHWVYKRPFDANGS